MKIKNLIIIILLNFFYFTTAQNFYDVPNVRVSTNDGSESDLKTVLNKEKFKVTILYTYAYQWCQPCVQNLFIVLGDMIEKPEDYENIRIVTLNQDKSYDEFKRHQEETAEEMIQYNSTMPFSIANVLEKERYNIIHLYAGNEYIKATNHASAPLISILNEDNEILAQVKTLKDLQVVNDRIFFKYATTDQKRKIIQSWFGGLDPGERVGRELANDYLENTKVKSFLTIVNDFAKTGILTPTGFRYVNEDFYIVEKKRAKYKILFEKDPTGRLIERVYYASGNKEYYNYPLEQVYPKKIKDGRYTAFYENGKNKIVANYENNKIIKYIKYNSLGYKYEWKDENGNINYIRSNNLKYNGEPLGAFLSDIDITTIELEDDDYSESDTICIEDCRTYDDEGDKEYYDYDDQILFSHYTNNEKIYYYPNGRKAGSIKDRKGYPTGASTFVDEDGNKWRTYDFSDIKSKKIHFKEFYKNGQIKYMGTEISSEELVSTLDFINFKMYSEEGILRLEFDKYNGENGTIKDYYETGELYHVLETDKNWEYSENGIIYNIDGSILHQDVPGETYKGK